jgi:hypothetical protein
VASESVFSFGGSTRLTLESKEMCLCLKDHLDAAERGQDKARLEGELDVVQEMQEYEVYQGATAPLSEEEQSYDEAQRISSEDE